MAKVETRVGAERSVPGGGPPRWAFEMPWCGKAKYWSTLASCAMLSNGTIIGNMRPRRSYNSEESRLLMDSSLQHASLAVDDTSLVTEHAAVEGAEGEHHIHLPNPSLWPFLLSAAVLVAVTGLLFLPGNPWLTIVALPFVIVGILGWALEDPMVAPKVRFVEEAENAHAKFKIGQDVLDKRGEWLGMVQARFSRYLLVDRGGLLARVYYVPQAVIADDIENNTLRLTVSEAELYARGLNSVPDDLYENDTEAGVPQIKGVPMFARGPLSPAETGHYNYGPNFPGINTDAAGSYYPEEIRPTPQKYVADRRRVYATDKMIPSRAVRAD